MLRGRASRFRFGNGLASRAATSTPALLVTGFMPDGVTSTARGDLRDSHQIGRRAGVRPRKKLSRRTNRLLPDLTVVNAAPRAIPKNENWQTSIAEEWLRKESLYEGADISRLRKKGPRRAAKADNCRTDRPDCPGYQDHIFPYPPTHFHRRSPLMPAKP